ncbi:MAG: glycosyltransferase family 2 protein [Ferruginibacter sp.]
MPDYPKISIVTPSFNQGEFIEETILSVITQNYPNLEYIIIDGGSTDGSVDIIKKYEKYLSYWVSEPDKGHGDALNKGFVRTTGDIMAWVNSDDKYFPWTLETVAQVFTQHEDINWIVGLYSNFDRKGSITSVRAEYRNIYSYIFRDLHIQQESVFWRRAMWTKTGGYIDASKPLMIDTELWCRFFLQDELWHLDRVLGGYRMTGLNRAHVFKKEVEADVNKSLTYLVEHLPEEKKRLLENIKRYSIDLRYYYKKIDEISGSLNKNLLLQATPHFLYQQAHNFFFRKSMEKQNLATPIQPTHDSLVIRRLLSENDKWVKQDMAYQFPY